MKEKEISQTEIHANTDIQALERQTVTRQTDKNSHKTDRHKTDRQTVTRQTDRQSEINDNYSSYQRKETVAISLT